VSALLFGSERERKRPFFSERERKRPFFSERERKFATERERKISERVQKYDCTLYLNQ